VGGSGKRGRGGEVPSGAPISDVEKRRNRRWGRKPKGLKKKPDSSTRSVWKKGVE